MRVIRQSRKDKGKRRKIDMDLEAQDSSSDDSEARGALLVGTRPQRGGGGGHPPPPLRTPKLSYGTMCFVGARDFVLGIGQGEIFLFDPMCLYS